MKRAFESQRISPGSNGPTECSAHHIFVPHNHSTLLNCQLAAGPGTRSTDDRMLSKARFEGGQTPSYLLTTAMRKCKHSNIIMLDRAFPRRKPWRDNTCARTDQAGDVACRLFIFISSSTKIQKSWRHDLEDSQIAFAKAESLAAAFSSAPELAREVVPFVSPLENRNSIALP